MVFEAVEIVPIDMVIGLRIPIRRRNLYWAGSRFFVSSIQ